MRLIPRSRRGSSEEVTRLFFATDIHGSDRCFRKFLNAAGFYSARYLVLGGDITGKTLVPIERKGTTYSVMLDGRRHDGLSEEERVAVERQLRDRGQYPVVGGSELLGRLDDDEAREEVFLQVIKDSISRWVEMAEQRLSGTGVRCFITPGNDDFFEIDDALSGGTAVEFVEGRRVALDDGREMITTGYSNPTPWRTPRELDEEALAERIRGMCDGVEDPESLVMVLHPPPHGTLLEQAPALDDELNIEMRGGAVQMRSVGSLAVREVIEEVQPLLALHGHVHESAAEQKLGRTLCINPGSEYTTGILRGALIGLSRDGIEAHQMVSG
jgi:Icc-related predicted phosphoesterase